jgi:hypothetical protein
MAITITGNGESGKGIGEWGMGISCYYNCYIRTIVIMENLVYKLISQG